MNLFADFMDNLQQVIHRRELGQYARVTFDVLSPTILTYHLGGSGGDGTQGSGNPTGAGGGGGGASSVKFLPL